MNFRCLCGVMATVLAVGSTIASEESPRLTRDVEIIQKMGEGVVAIFSTGANGQLIAGSGSIVHASGLILTNHHVVEDRDGVVLLANQMTVPFRRVGCLPEKDIAVIEISPPAGGLTTIPLGRSHDLLSGEPILVGGNPGGRGIVFSKGIISSPAVMRDVSALVMSQFPDDARDRFIQFDAASNGGNSGGPLLNAEGRQVGIVSAKVVSEENINYAIPIDRVLQAARDLLLAEERSRAQTGLTVDPLSLEVLAVDPQGPADVAGCRTGDQLMHYGKQGIANFVEWQAVLRTTPAQEPQQLVVERNAVAVEMMLLRQPWMLRPGERADNKKAGLRCEWAPSRSTRAPDWRQLAPQRVVTAPQPQLSEIGELPKDFYAVRMTGYVEIPAEGVYWFALESDDGSRMWLNEESLIDNDGPHPQQTVRATRLLAPGLHPLRIEYFELTGDEFLELRIGRDGEQQPLPVRYFRDPPGTSPN